MKSTRIILKKKKIKNGKEYVDQADIMDGISITKFGNKLDAQKVYLGFKQEGVDASLVKGVIIRRYKDKKRKEIEKDHIEQIEALKKAYKKKMEIDYEVIDKEWK